MTKGLKEKKIERLLQIGRVLYTRGIDGMQDAFEVCRTLEAEGSTSVTTKTGRGKGVRVITETVHDPDCFAAAHLLSRELRAVVAKAARETNQPDVFALYKKVLLFDAPYDFDSYCLYIEWNRPIEKQFYLPRRKQLLQLAQALQELEDDKLDLLCISLPPGVGKTTLALFFLTQLAGQHPEMQNILGSHNNEFLKSCYDELCRIFDPEGEYLYSDVFPNSPVVRTNAKAMRIDIRTAKRFETLEMSSVESGNAGKIRASGLLYCDDLVQGIEQALSRDQMDKLFQKYTIDFRQRKIGSCKELHIATRWSVHDVIGRLELQYENDPRAKFIRVPALDENDESNFDYPYGLGYTTKQLLEQREIMDDASFRALFMNEPIEREGALYSPDEVRKYFDLPDREPDAIVAVCDTKDQGDDYAVMPIVYQYGNDLYVEAILCDNGKPEIIEERMSSLLIKHKVQMCRFESNRAGGRVAETVQKKVREKGGITKITTKWNETNKETRIIMSSPYIKEHCLFKDESVAKGDKEYMTAMRFLYGWTMRGRNAHDDVPDAFADLANFMQGLETSTATIMRRPF